MARLIGYAMRWDDWTWIDNPIEGRFHESFAPGAFTRSLARRTPAVLLDHGLSPVTGRLPVTVPATVTEDATGLRVQAELHDTGAFAMVREAIGSGALSGMSVRFHTLDDDPRVGEDGELWVRVLAAELSEVSLTAFPAYLHTSVSLSGSA